MMKYLILILCFIYSTPLLAANPLLSPIEFLSMTSYEEVANKIQPSITYGIIKYDSNGFKKGDQVEILEDVSQGNTYCVKKGDFVTWVYSYTLTIVPPSTSHPLPLASDELELYMNHEAKSSLTPYYIWVDLSRQLVYVFFKPETEWILIRQMNCATGKPTTPTARGTFTILDRGKILHSGEWVKYWVKFYKNYLFHSLPLDLKDEVIDTRLGEAISNGCVRLLEEDAKWLFETVPQSTTVWVY